MYTTSVTRLRELSPPGMSAYHHEVGEGEAHGKWGLSRRS
jgi:hypothetical protein